MPYKNYCELPTPHGTFRMYDTGNELLRVVTFGDINKLGSKPMVRLHSSCLASEVFEARDCDCADQLREAMKSMAHNGSGIIFHLHQEGRGQGLSKKIQAVYKMQAEALDTAESFQAMGLEQDIRDYTPAIKVLKKMAIEQVRLVSNNPRKRRALEQAGIAVEVVNTHPLVRPENADYLQSKNDKLGHCLPLGLEHDNTGPIHFYHSDQTWGEFSNFSQHAVYLHGKIWRTTEHFYQAQKFSEPVLQERVRSAASPMLAKQIADQLESQHLQANWHNVKENVMWQALAAKFTQHPDLKELLLSTQQRNIAEHTRNDSYWGDAGDGTGLNRLGELLVQLRSQLRDNKEPQLCAE
ncbi:GTP cyclohydrolase II RibA [Photobacterium sp. GSS17]|uniref:GTP cyclohydrolase II RibA n=1 Tax=Photobacterium sp. GSS17 TaxID=3020715 RepID=UPI0023604BDB|nr:GTP cyclohydrolase II RibA [Photobacterium sp. GSS17]